MDTLWKVNGFFCDTASSSEKKYKRDRKEEGKMKGKRRRDGETRREEKEERR